MVEGSPIKVLIAKPGLDGHDRGAKVVVKALRDAGMEVLYTGRHQPVGAIVRAATDEDVEALGVSILSGAHLDYCRRLVEGLAEEGMDDVVLLIGGTIPAADEAALEELGFRVFGTGSDLDDIVAFLEDAVARRRGTGASA